MMHLRIEQAVFEGGDEVGRSPGFGDDWQTAAARLIAGYGSLPPHASAVFVMPLTRAATAVVQVVGRRARVLAVPAALYRALNDPFAIADRFPHNVGARGELETLEWTGGPLPARTLDDVRGVLKADDGPTFLGAAQALVDGGRVAFIRPTPAADGLRALWTLLPASSRADLSAATFAPCNELRFDVLVTPSAEGPAFRGYLTDAQAGDYPEGRYELALQTAAESGDEAKLAELLARRSAGQSLRLACQLLLAALALGVAVRVIPWEKLR
jgi:hypothetical protein